MARRSFVSTEPVLNVLGISNSARFSNKAGLLQFTSEPDERIAMSDQHLSRLSTRQASVVLLVLSGLLCSLTALAQTPSGPPSASTSSQAATQPPSKEALDAWHATMSKTPMPKTGCFTSSYPSTEWKEVPCGPAPTRRYPPRPGGTPGALFPNAEGTDSHDSAILAGDVKGIVDADLNPVVGTQVWRRAK